MGIFFLTPVTDQGNLEDRFEQQYRFSYTLWEPFCGFFPKDLRTYRRFDDLLPPFGQIEDIAGVDFEGRLHLGTIDYKRTELGEETYEEALARWEKQDIHPIRENMKKLWENLLAMPGWENRLDLPRQGEYLRREYFADLSRGRLLMELVELIEGDPDRQDDYVRSAYANSKNWQDPNDLGGFFYGAFPEILQINHVLNTNFGTDIAYLVLYLDFAVAQGCRKFGFR